jgi:hypothetical protein
MSCPSFGLATSQGGSDHLSGRRPRDYHDARTARQFLGPLPLPVDSNKIGEALRTLFVPTEPASDQILNALQELDHQQEDHETKEKQSGPSETKGDKIRRRGRSGLD